MSQDVHKKTPRSNLQEEDKASLSQEPAANEVWYVASKGFHSGPYEPEDLAERIRNNEFARNITLWTPGLKSWASLHNVQPLTQLLGLVPRRHTRIPFHGDLKVSDGVGATVKDLSLGGLGIEGLPLSEGTIVKVRVHSALLPTPLHVEARVVHVSGSRSGLQFIDLSKSDEEMIHEFVTQQSQRSLTE